MPTLYYATLRLGLCAVLLLAYRNDVIDAFAPPKRSTTTAMMNVRRRMTSAMEDQKQDSTVQTLTIPPSKNGSRQQQVTLIGTAHLSEKSNEQVKRMIGEIKPNVVMIELDPTRLGRIGIASTDDIDLEVLSTGEVIQIPNKSKKDDDKNENWLLAPLKKAVLDVVSRTARALLTGMYNDMSKEMKNDTGGGGEFLVAIRSAEECSETTRLVLGDRSSVTTIRRAAQLAWESGDAIGVLNRLNDSNAEEMKQLEEKVKKENPDIADDRGELQIAVMEALKEDDTFRDRLFHKLEQEVPEFTQAFLKERDYIMSESIIRELNKPDAERIVGVVGLAHVPGMMNRLKSVLELE